MLIIKDFTGTKMTLHKDQTCMHGNKSSNIFHEVSRINAKKFEIKKIQSTRKHQKDIFDTATKYLGQHALQSIIIKIPKNGNLSKDAIIMVQLHITRKHFQTKYTNLMT